ncbi:MAG: hypothetical protein WDN02_02905 [Methylovirgula sp.]|uniref:hypothetical protein n=1 Tax=Methylovirgula sp. TaxID=1978224 RepID=UPI00307607AA
MLADQQEWKIQSGQLNREIRLSQSWIPALLDFIARELPKWRDDPERGNDTAETTLNSRFCAYMNSATRTNEGWDFLQFRVEEPDESVRGRRFDLAPAPSAATIWIEGRRYTQYEALFPIECKRLPTPAGVDRDKREYLYSEHTSTGGVHRFKTGKHGAAHTIGAMIGYIQEGDIPAWDRQLKDWPKDLVAKGIDGWSPGDEVHMRSHDSAARLALLESDHVREGELQPIHIHHLWVDMN